MTLLSEHRKIEKRSRRERMEIELNRTRYVLGMVLKKVGPVRLGEGDCLGNVSVESVEVEGGIEWRAV